MAQQSNVIARWLMILLFPMLLAAGCTTVGQEESMMGTISGRVIYLERIALPPGAIVTVELRDVSIADAAAKTLASTRFEAEGSPPYPFELSFDADAIDERHTYALKAMISLGDRLLFTTDTHHPAFTGGEHELRVRSVGGSVGDSIGEQTADSASTLSGREWLLVSLGNERVAPLSDGRRPYLQFATSGRAYGFGGCNRFTGRYRLEGQGLEFSGMAMTRKACAEGMDLEQRFSRTLTDVTEYEIDDDRLALQDSAGNVLAVLRSGDSVPAQP